MVSDRDIVEYYKKLDRSLFMEENKRYAGIDAAFPIGHGQTISQPYIVALMTSLLNLQGTENVLEIGTGSGYQAAVLSRIAKEVYSIEIRESLGEQARSLLRDLGYDNVEVRICDGYQGWPSRAPFDAIMVTAAPDHVPQPLVDQLAPGGRMIIPVGSISHDLVLIERTARGVTRRQVLPVRFVPMTGEAERRR